MLPSLWLSSLQPLHLSDTKSGDGGDRKEPLRVASSNNAVSTAEPGRWTYLTTDPRMKTFFTATFTCQRWGGVGDG
jgi:hypothetical protein